MTEHHDVVVRRQDQDPRDQDGLASLLAAYHLQTQAEKGQRVADVDRLPERYRAEILDPAAAFADDAVLVASSGQAVVGCVVVTAPVDGRCEIKRLWTAPELRGRGIASGLVDAALAQAADSGAGTVRLSVWQWRAGAIALYERLGFTATDSWDGRDQLVCMERAV
ncbi:GNAT family N-acetyltransferase [Myceligenerans indicum]|uniref:GNAT family N-acetyltransferase n=1 Tax=Myceligenerans indicum TaxID=2593663 RepID=A0ABS1LQZ9_9MICO|nr:GNAT family N-acetyltransferase [Myceligenerans indicum]MBL0888685.1 GNAT family N-acetyltransferase [Myceligenerans indicum]